MTVEYEVIDQVAVLTMVSPPVNALGHGIREGLVAGLARANADVAVHAVVVCGHGKNFSAGADIKEFASGLSTREPHLLTVFRDIEASPKPVVAAIHGVCMGGGLELALVCHYRVAAPDARLALPEIKLGLLPGAGGTQRLPRVVGVERALEMIVLGTTVSGDELALQPGQRIFDRLSSDAFQLRGDAIAFAREVGHRDVPAQLVRNLQCLEPVQWDSFDVVLKSVPRAFRALRATSLAIDAVRAASELEFDAGLALERRCFNELKSSSESAALRHLFAAERAASKIKDVPPDVLTRELHSVGIVGAGTMGRGIAMSFLDAGLSVTLMDSSQAALDRAVQAIAGQYEAQVGKGKLSALELERRVALLRGSTRYEDLKDADLLVEAAFEDLGVKLEIFGRLDAVARDGAILASNTSTLDIDTIAAATGRPKSVLGMHFFSPANVMRLLEIVRGDQTAPEVLASVMGLARKMGKVPVVSGVCDGFIGNRMAGHYVRQAGLLLDEGATPEQVDQAMESFGFAMGPFRTCDLAGNDIGWAIRKRRLAHDPTIKYGKVLDTLCELGRFGQKVGMGWYDYPAGGRSAIPSPVVRGLLEASWQASGRARTPISDQDIVERLVLALVNEGAALLGEGIAQREGDIDLVHVFGYGFPAHRGGPMYYASQLGWRKVQSSMREFAKTSVDPGFWQVAPLIEIWARTETERVNTR